jgi:hypothetical protein
VRQRLAALGSALIFGIFEHWSANPTAWAGIQLAAGDTALWT